MTNQRLSKRFIIPAFLLAALSSSAIALQQPVLSNDDFNRANLKLSLGVKQLIAIEKEVAVNDERIHCDRRRLRGSPLRKNYCQTVAEYTTEQTLRELLRQRHNYPRRSPIVRFRRLPSTPSEGTASY